MNNSKSSSRVEIISHIPAEVINVVIGDYSKTGASVSVEKEKDDGFFRIRAEFTPSSKYAASGSKAL